MIGRRKASNARFIFFKSLCDQENHEAAHASGYSIDRELPPIDLNVVAGN
jgi:hypothetical protein